MIAELFYPKELKEIIEDLRDKDDLNEGALIHFRQITNRNLLIALVFIVVVLYMDGVGTIFACFSIGAPFLVFYEGRERFESCYKPYITGTKKLLSLNRGKFRFRGGPKCRLVFYDCENKKQFPTPLLSELNSFETISENGLQVMCFIDIKKGICMPNMDFLKAKYSLSLKTKEKIV